MSRLSQKNNRHSNNDNWNKHNLNDCLVFNLGNFNITFFTKTTSFRTQFTTARTCPAQHLSLVGAIPMQC